MKTRNGLVSNSSSSSFVVAFPHKPASSADVWKFMFNGKDGGLSCYDQDRLSYSQVASNVFASINDKDRKAAKLKEIAEEFESRYYYIVKSSSTMFDDKVTDQDGGSWYYKMDKYCGSDPAILEDLRQAIIKHEKLSNQLRDEEKRILKRGPKPVAYAWKDGTDYNTKKPYTKIQIDAYENYNKQLEKFKTTDKDYLAYNKKWRELHDDPVDKLTRKLALIDAKAFMKDNEGKFIFIVSYSDNEGGDGSTMEHGNVFRNVPFSRISHH